jgi:hypothetical protein
VLWQDALRPLLHIATTRDTETAVYVAERYRAGIRMSKACSTEQQRREYIGDLEMEYEQRMCTRNVGMVSLHELDLTQHCVL